MSQVKIENVTKNDREGWLTAIWAALESWDDYVIDDIDVGDEDIDSEQHAENHDEICTVMAWVREELGLPSEVEANTAEDGHDTYDPEQGMASIFIELEDSVITVTHGSDKVPLGRKDKAVNGDWDRLIAFMRDDLDIEWLVS